MSIFKKTDTIPNSDLLFSNKDLIKIMIPLILRQVLNVTVGTADSMMVAYAGEAAVSGVSLINTLDTMLIIFFTALVGGGSVIISQTLGKKDPQAANEAAKQLLYTTTIVATLLTITVLIFRRPLLSLLFGNIEPDVMASAEIYFFIVALSFPLLAISESCGSCFHAAGNTMIALIVAVILNIINVCGNAALIIGFDMGAAGAALSTTLSRFFGAAIMFILVLNKKYPVHIERIFHYRPNFSIVKKILYIGVPNSVENTMFQFGRLLTQSLISSMGTAVIAANAVALTISNFQYMTGTACSSAMITVVGRCIGAGEKRQAKRYSRVILYINYVTIWAVIIVTLLFLKPLVSVYNLSDFSSELSRQLIFYHAIIAALIWPIGFMLPSAFRAASDVRFSMVISMLSMWLFRVAGGYVLALDTVSVFGLFSFSGLGLGIKGVWIAMFIDWVFRVSFFLYRYLSGKWMRSRSIV